MRPLISVLTLGVDDLDRALAFYRDVCGFPTAGIVGREFAHGAVAFFDLHGGLKLAIWERDSLSHDCGLARGARSPAEFSIGHNVGSPQEVDAILALVGRGGGRIVKPAQETFYGGYAGYFSDPDGHLWEVVFNPALGPDS